MSIYEEQISKMRWSYSRLCTFEQCRYAFYLKYIINDPDLYLDEGNYYAEVGSFCHSILEKIFNGEISPEEASEYYYQHFDENVLYTVKPSIMEKTYEICANYFADFSLDWLKGYKVIGAEKKVETTINGHNFLGFIDLLIEDEKTGDLIIVDHKSAAYPFKKDGKSVLKKSEKTFSSYKKQMYLYAYAVYKEYGKYPTEIWWNHFKDNKIAKIKFDMNDYEEAIAWLETTIDEIKNEEEFSESAEFFYCSNICEYRNCCEYREFGGDE